MTLRAFLAAMLLAAAAPALAQPPGPTPAPLPPPQGFAPTPPYRQQAEARGPIVGMSVDDVVRRAMG